VGGRRREYERERKWCEKVRKCREEMTVRVKTRGARPCANTRETVRPHFMRIVHTVSCMAVPQTVHTLCPFSTVVCRYRTTMRLSGSAQVTKNLKNKEKKYSKRTLSYYFFT